MSIEDLCALPVADLAAPDSALFLWATFPQLPEALRLIEAWGFTYKSVAFVWLKKNKKADSCLHPSSCFGTLYPNWGVFWKTQKRWAH